MKRTILNETRCETLMLCETSAETQINVKCVMKRLMLHETHYETL